MTRLQQSGANDIRTDAQHLAAERLANSISIGVHGRRRAGTGDSFWQFRNYQSDDPSHRIDWRQSAKGQHLFVREQEHESMETFWIWCNCGATMNFQSEDALQTKSHSAMILTMALTLLVQRGGEKFGLLGTSDRAYSGMVGFEKFTRDLLTHESRKIESFDKLPDTSTLPFRSVVVLISDFLDDPKVTDQTLKLISARGCHAHLLHIIDPAVEFFPFQGDLELANWSTSETLTFGRAEAIKDKYIQRFQQHKDELKDLSRQYDCKLIQHRTNTSENLALLAQYLALRESK